MNKLMIVGILLVSSLGACTWVALEDSGKLVRVVNSSDAVQGCQLKGEITASVRDKIAFVNRDSAKVKDEVEALARNQAAELSADTIIAVGELDHGSRRFDAYRCK